MRTCIQEDMPVIRGVDNVSKLEIISLSHGTQGVLQGFVAREYLVGINVAREHEEPFPRFNLVHGDTGKSRVSFTLLSYTHKAKTDLVEGLLPSPGHVNQC